MRTTVPRSVEWGIIVEDMIGSFVLQILGEDSGGTLYLGSAGTGLVVLGGAS